MKRIIFLYTGDERPTSLDEIPENLQERAKDMLGEAQYNQISKEFMSLQNFKNEIKPKDNDLVMFYRDESLNRNKDGYLETNQAICGNINTFYKNKINVFIAGVNEQEHISYYASNGEGESSRTLTGGNNDSVQNLVYKPLKDSFAELNKEAQSLRLRRNFSNGIVGVSGAVIGLSVCIPLAAKFELKFATTCIDYFKKLPAKYQIGIVVAQSICFGVLAAVALIKGIETIKGS